MFELFFYQPILNLIVFIYNIIPGHDLGVTIILMTIIIKIALWPLSKKALVSQKELQDLQPEMERIKKEHKDNKEELGRATMSLYKNKKINPFSSCLPLLIQLPFFIAVFHVFRDGFDNGSLDLVYSFISKPESIDSITIAGTDLSKRVPLFAILAGAAQYAQTKLTLGKKSQTPTDPTDTQAMINKQMLYFMPILTVVIGMTLPGGLSLYWLTTTIITVFQQNIIAKSTDDKKKSDSPTISQKSSEPNSEQQKKPEVIEGEIMK